MISLGQLVMSMGVCPQVRAQRFIEPLNEAMDLFEINTPARAAAFLAQIGHESGRLLYVREVWGPTATQLKYEGRKDLGNTQPGDGARYRGRGLIQITGRSNYAMVRDKLRGVLGEEQVPDFEETPEALEEERWATLSAGLYWHERGCNEAADGGQFEIITRKINGGMNGYADRLALWGQAKTALV